MYRPQRPEKMQKHRPLYIENGDEATGNSDRNGIPVSISARHRESRAPVCFRSEEKGKGMSQKIVEKLFAVRAWERNGAWDPKITLFLDETGGHHHRNSCGFHGDTWILDGGKR